MRLKYFTLSLVAIFCFLATSSHAINMPAKKEAISITDIDAEIDKKLADPNLSKKETRKLERAKKKIAKFQKKIAKKKAKVQSKLDLLDNDKLTLGIILLAAALAVGLIGLIISLGGLINLIASLLALGGFIFIIWYLLENV